VWWEASGSGGWETWFVRGHRKPMKFTRPKKEEEKKNTECASGWYERSHNCLGIAREFWFTLSLLFFFSFFFSFAIFIRFGFVQVGFGGRKKDKLQRYAKLSIARRSSPLHEEVNGRQEGEEQR
jgi:hypothetical protein